LWKSFSSERGSFALAVEQDPHPVLQLGEGVGQAPLELPLTGLRPLQLLEDGHSSLTVERRRGPDEHRHRPPEPLDAGGGEVRGVHARAW
jgi:hypothetical protein